MNSQEITSQKDLFKLNRQWLELFFADTNRSKSQESLLINALPKFLGERSENLIVCSELHVAEYFLRTACETSEYLCNASLNEVLHILLNHNCSKESFSLLSRIVSKQFEKEKEWTTNCLTSLGIFAASGRRAEPGCYFYLPGSSQSVISLPPIPKGTFASGWSLNIWFNLDSSFMAHPEKNTPYLFSFKSRSGFGYTGHFVGQSFIISFANKNNVKTFQKCIPGTFIPNKWYMVTLVFLYGSWSKSELQVYLDANLVSEITLQSEMKLNDSLDIPIIGGSGFDDITGTTLFCGKIATFMACADCLTNLQIYALLRLGFNYRGYFKFESEAYHVLNAQQRAALYESSCALSTRMIFCYSAATCDERLCLNICLNRGTSSLTKPLSHAFLRGEVLALQRQTVLDGLRSAGGVSLFFPLFAKIDMPLSKCALDSLKDTPDIACLLLSAVFNSTRTSHLARRHFAYSDGMVIFANCLKQADPRHANLNLLFFICGEIAYWSAVIRGRNTEEPLSSIVVHLEKIIDMLLLDASIWIRSPVEVQAELFKYLSSTFVELDLLRGPVRRASALIQILYSLRTFYWISKPALFDAVKSRGHSLALERPDMTLQQVTQIRANILLFVKQLFSRKNASMMQEEELVALLNHLQLVHEVDNIVDVLYFVLLLMNEQPAVMVPAFDHCQGMNCVYRLMASSNAHIRIQALKLLGFFLQRSKINRKNSIMRPYALFSMIVDRLLAFNDNKQIDQATYAVLLEILVEQMTIGESEPRVPTVKMNIENPEMLKVIAELIMQSQQSDEILSLKETYLRHLLVLFRENLNNRRAILQQSVWQDWLIRMAKFHLVDNPIELTCCSLVLDILGILLFHSIRFESGGWRVWIDTLAMVHVHMSTGITEQTVEENGTQVAVAAVETSKTKLPEFTWSYVHLLLLDRLLRDIEDDLQQALLRANLPGPIEDSPVTNRTNVSSSDDEGQMGYQETELRGQHDRDANIIIHYLGKNTQLLFRINLVHLVSQLADTLVSACGGLLPLLAVATNPSGDVELLEHGHGFSIGQAMNFVLRVAAIADYAVFHTDVNLSLLEKEKNMAPGGILRQTLRLTCLCAVRNCLEIRYKSLLPDQALLKRLNRLERGEEDAQLSQAPGHRETLLAWRIKNLSKLAQRMRTSPAMSQQPNRNERKTNFWLDNFFQQHEVNYSVNLRDLLYGVTPVFDYPENFLGFTFQKTVLQPVDDFDFLFQHVDINRLHNVIFRDEDETRQMQFLTISTIYFLSVLMVSKYRDTLDPDQSRLLDASKIKIAPEKQQQRLASTSSNNSSSLESTGRQNEIENNNGHNEDEPVEEEKPAVATINVSFQSAAHKSVESRQPFNPLSSSAQAEIEPEEASLENVELSESASIAADNNGSTRSITDDLTNRLEKSLGTSVPFLRDLMLDFAAYLSKTLLGSHGQELLASSMVMLRNSASSIIELVMLLCSQEWQNTLQKNAGMAFIELVNEGRLLTHACRDHINRVAQEAVNILVKMQIADNQAHAAFEQACAEGLAARREEDNICSRMIEQRNEDSCEIVQQMLIRLQRERRVMQPSEQDKDHFRLDSWEDDSRRRRRLVPNPYGTDHSDCSFESIMAAEKPQQDSEEKINLNQAIQQAVVARPGSEDTAEAQSIGSSAESELLNSHLGANNDDDSLQESIHVAPFGLAGSYQQRKLHEESPVVLTTNCFLMSSGLRIYGLLLITKTELHFNWMPRHPDNAGLDRKTLAYTDHLNARWLFPEIRAIFTRRHLHRNVALELFLSTRTAVMLVFATTEVMQKVLNLLPPVGIGMKYKVSQSRGASLASPRKIFQDSVMTKRWQQREMSNFDYLMYLNTIAGRTYNDLNQYPIFPWVLADYTSDSIDLNSMASYRDLSKPIGALNPKRKEFFDKRFEEWDDDSQPAFHFGTHYSTAAFVLSYLIRIEPFTTMFLDLQGGRFDNPNRIFFSLAKCWQNCQSIHSDVKELIPEFFYLPEIFRNENGYNFGVNDDNHRVDDVVLPPWAQTPEDFVQIHRRALESEFVSCQLHHWIDLIFGHKQRGPEAVKATNVFCYLTYEDCIDFTKITDPVLMQALENQIQSFGQTPSQLLLGPHPARNSALHISPQMFQPIKNEICMVLKLASNSPLIHLECNTMSTNRFTTAQSAFSSCVVTVGQNLLFSVHRWSLAVASLITQNLEKSQNSNGNEGPLPLLSQDQQSGEPSKRYLGDSFSDEDERALGPECGSHFILAPDNRSLIACGYMDMSFRVFCTETGRAVQIVRGGHSSPIVCIARSECCSGGQNFYLATGSQDTLVMLWPFDIATRRVYSEYVNEPPVPHSILEGHSDTVCCVCVSTEMGLVFSGAVNGVLLQHTLRGELLRRLDMSVMMDWPSTSKPLKPMQMCRSREGHCVILFARQILALYTVNGRLLRCMAVQDLIKSTDEFSSDEIRINCIKLSNCGMYLLCGDSNGFVWCVRALTFERLHLFPRCTAAVRCFDLSSDQRFLMVGLESGCIVVLSLNFNQWHPEFQTRSKNELLVDPVKAPSENNNGNTNPTKCDEDYGKVPTETTTTQKNKTEAISPVSDSVAATKV